MIGARPLLLRVGGSLPVMSALEEKGMPTILTGFDLPEGNIHSPNERFRVEHIALGVETAKELYTLARRSCRRPRQSQGGGLCTQRPPSIVATT